MSGKAEAWSWRPCILETRSLCVISYFSRSSVIRCSWSASTCEAVFSPVWIPCNWSSQFDRPYLENRVLILYTLVCRVVDFFFIYIYKKKKKSDLFDFYWFIWFKSIFFLIWLFSNIEDCFTFKTMEIVYTGYSTQLITWL